MAESLNKLFFDPDQHPDETLKAFNEFVQTFELRYDATYPDPHKVSMDSIIERWKLANEVDTKPNLEQYEEIRTEWRSKDRVAKFLGIYSSKRSFVDWKAAEVSETNRKAATWEIFLQKMREYYKPTENSTLKNFQFRSLTQSPDESFMAFCNRIDKEAKHCDFKCTHADCTAESIAIRDQIVIGARSDKIREESLKNSWDLDEVKKNGTRLESAAKGVAEITGELSVNKIGKYSFRNINKQESSKDKYTRPDNKQNRVSCYFCGISTVNIRQHIQQCGAKSSM